MRRSLLLPSATVALTVAGVIASPALGATPAGNLLQNPGAEVPATLVSEGAYSAPAAWDVFVSPPGTDPRSAPYDSCYGGGDVERNALDIGNASPGGGTRFFFAGQSSTVFSSQTIALDPDVVGKLLRIGGSFGGFSSQDDQAVLSATFLDSNNAPIGATSIATQPVLAADRADTTGWVARSNSRVVPGGTKNVRITLTQTRSAGSDNDGYADDLYATFDAGEPARQAPGPACVTPPPVVTTPPPAPPSPPPPPVVPVKPPGVKKLVIANLVTGLPSTKRCLSRRSFRIRLKNPSGTRIASASVRVNGKVVATRRGSRVTAPVDLKGLPKGKYTVKITTKLGDGRTVTGTRAYRTCAPKKR